jgi:predicted MFS family arabinose efflux permease
VTGRPVPLGRNRDFLLLWGGMAVSVLGSRAAAIAYPLLVLALTGSPALAGLIGFLATLPYLVVQLPAGALVDRLNRKRLMIACDLVRALAVGSVAAALLLDSLSLVHLGAVALVEGTAFVFHNLAQSAAVRHVVHPTQLASALGRNEARERAASLLGAPLGGLLFGLGRAVPFLVDALSYLVSLVALLLIRKDFQAPAESDAPRTTRMPGEVKEGLVWLWRQPFLRATALLVAGSNALFSALVLVLIVIARDGGASPARTGLILAGAGAGGVLGSLFAPWLETRLSMKRVVIGANWVWALLMPLIVVAPGPLALGAIFAGMAFVGPVWNVAIGAYQLTITPDRLLGRVTSAETLLAYGAIPLGSLGAGLLLETLGARGATGAIAAGMLVMAVAATASRGVRTAPSLREAQAAASTV